MRKNYSDYEKQIVRRQKRKNRWIGIFYLVTFAIILFTVISTYYYLADNSKGKVFSGKNDETTSSNNRRESETQIDKAVSSPISSSWNLVLINKSTRIANDFKVDLAKLSNGHAIDKRAYPELVQMLDDAKAAGLDPIICSSYRTTEKQQELFHNQVQVYLSQGYNETEAEEKAAFWVARPGTSEHHTGLAVDIVAKSYQILDKNQEQTAEQKWLIANCYKYGFILRYPTAKSEITGVGYEPWHYRYVGIKAATEIMERGICLEEYLSVPEIK